jgi:hypothetical protein
MIMYFFMLPKIFTSITRNTRALHTHMLLARYARENGYVVSGVHGECWDVCWNVICVQSVEDAVFSINSIL